MAKAHGRTATLSLTDVGAVSRDLSNFLTNIGWPGQVATASVAAFGDTDESYVTGLKSRTMSLQGFFDPTASTGPDDVFANLLGGGAAGTVTTSFTYGPSGSAVGKIKYTGAAWVTAYQVTSPIGGAIGFTATLMVNGAATRGTF
jgi:hypothetical protein